MCGYREKRCCPLKWTYGFLPANQRRSKRSGQYNIRCSLPSPPVPLRRVACVKREAEYQARNESLIALVLSVSFCPPPPHRHTGVHASIHGGSLEPRESIEIHHSSNEVISLAPGRLLTMNFIVYYEACAATGRTEILKDSAA